MAMHATFLKRRLSIPVLQLLVGLTEGKVCTYVFILLSWAVVVLCFVIFSAVGSHFHISSENPVCFITWDNACHHSLAFLRWGNSLWTCLWTTLTEDKRILLWFGCNLIVVFPQCYAHDYDFGTPQTTNHPARNHHPLVYFNDVDRNQTLSVSSEKPSYQTTHPPLPFLQTLTQTNIHSGLDG